MVVKIKWNYLRNNYNLLNDIEVGLNYVTLFENNCNKEYRSKLREEKDKKIT